MRIPIKIFLLLVGFSLFNCQSDEDPGMVTPNPTPNPNPGVAALETVININSGGPSFTFEEQMWAADTLNNAINTYAQNKAIANTDNDKLYHTEASDSTGGFSYQIPAEAGFYQVTLHFAEIFHGLAGRAGRPGKRVFDYDIEGQVQINDFDILAETDTLTAIVFTYDSINVSDDLLEITFSNVVDRAKVSGIEIDKWVLN